jgi:hypothetical protein
LVMRMDRNSLSRIEHALYDFGVQSSPTKGFYRRDGIAAPPNEE